MEIAERYLNQEAQEEIPPWELNSLVPEKVTSKGANNDDIHIILVGGSAKVTVPNISQLFEI